MGQRWGHPRNSDQKVTKNLAFLEDLVGPPHAESQKTPNQTETKCENSKISRFDCRNNFEGA